MLTETIAASGLGAGLRGALSPWRKQFAVHDPAKVLLDLALTVALGGEHLADVAVIRAEPALYGLVASDPTISRTIDALAADVDTVLNAIDGARATARARAWALAGNDAPDHHADAKHPVVIDLDATLVTAHSDKESAARTWKKGYGFHPLCAFLDHGPEGTGEPLVIKLRTGNAGSNTAADHVTVTKQALAQLPTHRPGLRPGKRVLIRTDGAGATHDFMDYLHAQRVSYSVGFTLPTNTADLLEQIPDTVWTPAYNADGDIRDGAWVAELTGLLDLTGWPNGMRVIARKERPHPGAQLRITDVDGHRVTAFVTNTARGRANCPTSNCATAAALGVRTGSATPRTPACARCRCTTSPRTRSGARSSPWPATSSPGCRLLALTGTEARKWEPKRLRMRLFTVPAAIATSAPDHPTPPRRQSPLGPPRRARDHPAQTPRRPATTSARRPRLTRPGHVRTTNPRTRAGRNRRHRDDTRATVVPRCHNQTSRPDSRQIPIRPTHERSRLIGSANPLAARRANPNYVMSPRLGYLEGAALHPDRRGGHS